MRFIVASVGCWMVIGRFALGAGAPSPNAPQSVPEAIQLLQTTAEDRVTGLRTMANDRRPGAIDTLARSQSPEAVACLLDILKKPYADRQIKQLALAALGQMGTKPAIEAVGDFETWAAQRHGTPTPFRFGYNEFPVSHFAALNLKPLATAQGKDNLQWAIYENIYAPWKGGRLVTWSKDGKEWAAPIFIGEQPEPAEVLRKLAEGTTTIAGLTPDSDKDGLSDVLEKCLGTDPNNPDSDKDGVKDGEDDNPLTPRGKVELDELAQIRQAVFLVTFGTSNSRDVLLVRTSGVRDPSDDLDFPKQEYHGYAGWVLPTETSRDGWVNVVGFSLKRTSDTTAECSIRDREGSMAGGNYSVQLKKVLGKWVVIGFSLRGVA
jgi:hypothetical protein